MAANAYEVVIGLEIHVQLNTVSKMFSGASTRFGAEPNAQASLVDLGFPGVLPVVNEAVYRKAIAFGLGVGATINRRSVFDRKNYFYPDLPKGYQITQLTAPIVSNGKVEVVASNGSTRTVRVLRAHLEEDAGKSMHEDFYGQSGIDLNRAGTPLLEIVSEPDMRSPEEAVAYAKYIHELVKYLDVSDGDMSQGSFRCDANVSLRLFGASELGTRTETKNVNSFRFLELAIRYEIARQASILDGGGKVRQETLLYDSERDETRPMRSKETSRDYRYFPEPDLLPVEIDETYIAAVRSAMPELPRERQQRYVETWGLSPEDAGILVSSPQLADYFEAVSHACDDPKLASNWVRVELLAQLNQTGLTITESPVSAADLAAIITRIKDGTISGKIGKTIFEAIWRGEASSVDEYIKTRGLTQVSGLEALGPIIDGIIAAYPVQVAQFKSGKSQLLGFFVGQAMKVTGGKANPQQVNDLVLQKLSPQIRTPPGTS